MATYVILPVTAHGMCSASLIQTGAGLEVNHDVLKPDSK